MDNPHKMPIIDAANLQALQNAGNPV